MLLRRSRRAVLLIATAIAGACIWAGAQTLVETTDKYKWLEDVTSERSLAWVKAENARTDKTLKADPLYAQLQAAALKVLESPQRLPDPDLNGPNIYNTWQDSNHMQGILRRTSVSYYLTADPHWQTVLDYDALSKQDSQKWVQHGRTCLYPGNDLCMMELSAGGEDAATLREFNLESGRFVQNGFVLPRSKQAIDWIDKDSLLVARDWGPGTMTKSGYPFVVKLWRRGQPLNTAKEIYRGMATDMDAGPMVMHDANGHQLTFVIRRLNFFEAELFLLLPQGVIKAALPRKADLVGMVSGQLIVRLRENWTPEKSSTQVAQGSIVVLDTEAIKHDPMHLRPDVVFAPTSTEFAQDAAVTKNYLLVTTLQNVQGRVYSYAPNAHGGWNCHRFSVPDNRTVNIQTANWSDDRFFLSVSGFLTPSSLLLGDASSNTLKPAKFLPPQFDTSRDTVEQFQAVSKDGTKVPYFVVRPKNMKYDGANPTVLTAYGGFEISNTPAYDAVMGKLW
ncbi:MAG TPA: hypothetical protein VFA65_09410, partial [Bryobacteraceae bacterium]|nr:hypothetical protein [Bryobacteraceae bacterium]